MNKKERDVWEEVLSGVQENKAGLGRLLKVKVLPAMEAFSKDRYASNPLRHTEVSPSRSSRNVQNKPLCIQKQTLVAYKISRFVSNDTALGFFTNTSILLN